MSSLKWVGWLALSLGNGSRGAESGECDFELAPVEDLIAIFAVDVSQHEYEHTMLMLHLLTRKCRPTSRLDESIDRPLSLPFLIFIIFLLIISSFVCVEVACQKTAYMTWSSSVITYIGMYLPSLALQLVHLSNFGIRMRPFIARLTHAKMVRCNRGHYTYWRKCTKWV